MKVWYFVDLTFLFCGTVSKHKHIEPANDFQF